MISFRLFSFWRKLISGIMACVFAVSSMGFSSAQSMPATGEMVALSPAFQPPLLKGIKVYGNDPFRFDFILDQGETCTAPGAMQKGIQENCIAPGAVQVNRLVKYFLAALTVPEKDLWVNLSPYEKDRIVPDGFGQTEMGRDLLAQDYILKQITASLIYPENGTGKAFWGKVYKAAFEKYGTTDVPVDTFNKVWIVPEKATVYENKDAAFVVNSHLKVMLETDYFATAIAPGSGQNNADRPEPGAGEVAKDVIREIIIPILEKEVNEGQNFASLRQVYYSLILATWYKRKVKDSVISQAYVDRNKLSGVDIEDKAEKEKIWAKYVEAFRKGVFDLIKEEKDPYTQEIASRKYFSGGMGFNGAISAAVAVTTDAAALPQDASLDDAQIIQMKADMAEALDQRPVAFGLLKAPFVGYAMAVKDIINPDDREMVAVYGGSGADISSFFLSTNATRAYFVDIADVDAGNLQSLLDKWDRLEVASYGPGYLYTKQEVGFGDSGYDYGSTFSMIGIEHKLLLELKSLGVDKQSLRVMSDDQGLVTIEFEWAYLGRGKQIYKLSFIQADLTSPEHYPAALTTVLDRGIDIYYQRAGLFLPVYYDQFLKYFSDALRPGGFLVTDDNKLSRAGFDEVDPDGMLTGFSFKGELISDGMRRYGAQILDTFKDTGTDTSRDAYGWEVNIRQKKSDADKAQTIDVKDYYMQGGRALAYALKLSLRNGGQVFLREEGMADLEVLEELKVGAGASVFLCKNDQGKKVIVKILSDLLRDDLEEEDLLELQSIYMFFDGSRVDEMAKSLFAGLEGGGLKPRSFFSLDMIRMEYIEGKSFSEIAGLEARLPILVNLIERLAYVHRRYKTFHGDLNARNIIITPDGQPKLIDWDFLRMLRTSDDIAQIRFGMKYKDIFSIGVLLLMSYAPSAGFFSKWEDMFKPIDFSRRDPTRVEGVEAVPAGMLQIINKAMLVDPKDHYESLDELLVDLRQELKAEEVVVDMAQRVKAVGIDRAQADLQNILISNSFNDPAWLGSLKDAVEKEYNQGKALAVLPSWMMGADGTDVRIVTDRLSADDYVYWPVIRALNKGGELQQLLLIMKVSVARQFLNGEGSGWGVTSDSNDVLFLRDSSFILDDRKEKVARIELNTFEIKEDTLRGKGFASEAYPAFVEFLSRNFASVPIKGYFVNLNALKLFSRYFLSQGIGHYSIADWPAKRSWEGVVPRNFQALDNKNSSVDKAQAVIDVFDYSGSGRSLGLGMARALLDEGKIVLQGVSFKYEIDGYFLKGEGGYVFTGRDTQGGERVVIKVLNKTYLQNGFVDKESIISFFSVIEDDEKAKSLFAGFVGGPSRFVPLEMFDLIQMEFVDGKNLGDIKGLQERVPIILDVVEKMAYIHRQYKTFHGDLNVGNIIVTPEGKPKIIDWDLLSMASAGSVEQIKWAKKYKDIYSIGVCLLYSYAPFADISRQGWKNLIGNIDITQREPSVLSGVEGIPGGMLRIIEKAVLVDPKDHYETLDELLKDLRLELKAEGLIDAAEGFNKGGIDLSPSQMDLQIEANGAGFRVDIDPAQIERLKASPGLTPVIMGVQPLNSLRQFLGVL